MRAIILPFLSAILCFFAVPTFAQPRFDPADGHLTQLSDGTDFLENSTNALGLWKLEAAGVSLEPQQAKHFEWHQVSRGRWKLIWTDFGTNAPDLKVIVTVQTDGSVSRWNFALENFHPLQLQRIRFPRIPSLSRQTNEVLAVSHWMGELTRDPRAKFANGGRIEWDYPGALSLQCLALYQQDGPGLAFSCDDTAAYRKVLALFAEKTGALNYEMVHLVERDAAKGRRYEIPYAAVIKSFRGDWFTAAEWYRSWATNQPWARESRLKKHLQPDWILQTGMWVWNRGRSDGVLAPAEALEKQLGLPVSVFWHWWHGCAYDTGFPEYLPPREGNQSFTNTLRTAHEDGIHAIVYMNQRLWGMTTESWTNENAARFAVKTEAGTIHPEVYNTFTKLPCASMCMGTEFWRDKYAGLASSAINQLGVDGIYMDQACSSLSCFDTNHPHPPGGGRYWIQGFQKLSRDIRHRANRSVALGGEGCGEAWLPYLDVMLTLQVSKERYSGNNGWEPIPFFQAVYHPYAVFYGNYSSLTMPPYDDLWPKQFAPAEPLQLLDRKYARQFRMEQARAFAWGLQPTIANFLPSQLRDRPDETAFMMSLARLRMKFLKYFLHGTMLRAPELNAPEKTIDMSRLSIYAGQQGALKTFSGDYPTAIASAWRAPDGNVAITIVNMDDEPRTFALDLNRPEYGLTTRTQIFRTDDSGRQPLGDVDFKNPVQLKLNPSEACVLEFNSSRPSRP
jgi:Domain of unknown function (DUF6259)